MDPPSSKACGGLFPDKGRSLDQLGVRSQGKSGISRGLQEAIRKTQSPWHSLQGWTHTHGFCFRCKSCVDLLRAHGVPQPDFFLCSTFLPSTMRLWQYQVSSRNHVRWQCYWHLLVNMNWVWGAFLFFLEKLSQYNSLQIQCYFITEPFSSLYNPSPW